MGAEMAIPLMDAKARVLIVSTDRDRSSAWSQMVRALGYDSVLVDPGTALAQARLYRADCALVEAGFDPKVLTDLLRGRNEMPGLPLLLLEPDFTRDQAQRPPNLRAYADGAPFEATSTIKETAVERHVRLRLAAMIRVKTMADEWRRRHAVFSALGHEPEQPADMAGVCAKRDATILFAGDPGPEYATVESLFADDRTLIVGAFTPTMTVDYLSRHAFDVLVLSARDSVEGFLPVVSALRRNPRLVPTPVVILAPRTGLRDTQTALRAGVTDIVFRPLEGEDWADRIRTFLTESVMRKALGATLNAAQPGPLTDPLTGLSNPQVFERYIMQCLEDQRASPRAWSVMVIEIGQAMCGDGPLIATSDSVFRDAAAMVAGLTRASDFKARVGPRHVAVAMPNTPRDAATQTVRRVVGALSATAFEGVQGNVVEIVPRSAVVVSGEEDSPREMLTRALDSIRY